MHRSKRWSANKNWKHQQNMEGLGENTTHYSDKALKVPDCARQELLLHPVSFSLLMALERSRTHPRKPAPCFLWIFLWFHTLMVMESVFPTYLQKIHIRRVISEENTTSLHSISVVQILIHWSTLVTLLYYKHRSA